MCSSALAGPLLRLSNLSHDGDGSNENAGSLMYSLAMLQGACLQTLLMSEDQILCSASSERQPASLELVSGLKRVVTFFP